MRSKWGFCGQALRWQRDGRAVAIATVVASWGSAPRPVGSKLAVAEDGAFAGSVSGGCVENAVIAASLECIADGAPRLLDYAGDAKWPWDVGLPCGGTIRVYVERISPKHAAALHARERGHVIALITNLATGAYAKMTEQAGSGDTDSLSQARAVLPEASSAWRTQLISAEGGDLFIEVHRPSLRLMHRRGHASGAIPLCHGCLIRLRCNNHRSARRLSHGRAFFRATADAGIARRRFGGIAAGCHNRRHRRLA